MSDKALIVIPARMGSSRFRGKPLALIAGKMMIQRVWEIAEAVNNADAVLIATDDDEIMKAAESFGARAVMTSESCRTGTDRVFEAAQKLEESYEIVFSFQGDSVLTPPWIVEQVLREMRSDSNVRIATPAVLLEGEAKEQYVAEKKAGGTTGTSVVFDRFYNAMYFSKGLIPFPREAEEGSPLYRHIGLYGYRFDALEAFCDFEDGYFERVEKLEQLRALENGIPIRVVPVDYRGRTPASVDVRSDVDFAERIIAEEGELV
jgi:3-deoxy-manno-octulosonate cytidylyltransferase (CMP-KDO synthetase)